MAGFSHIFSDRQTRPIKQLAVIRAQQLGFDVGSGRGEHPQRGRRAESVTEM